MANFLLYFYYYLLITVAVQMLPTVELDGNNQRLKFCVYAIFSLFGDPLNYNGKCRILLGFPLQSRNFLINVIEMILTIVICNVIAPDYQFLFKNN